VSARIVPAAVDLVDVETGAHMPPVMIHPGERLAERLVALNMSASELARCIKVPTNRVTAIVNGQRGITADTALRLAHFFGTSAESWLDLQSRYDLRAAEVEAGEMLKQLPTLKLMVGSSRQRRPRSTIEARGMEQFRYGRPLARLE
jgi:antitoxin HigA-1